MAVDAAYVNVPPVVTAGADQTLTEPTSTATLTANATALNKRDQKTPFDPQLT